MGIGHCSRWLCFVFPCRNFNNPNRSIYEWAFWLGCIAIPGSKCLMYFKIYFMDFSRLRNSTSFHSLNFFASNIFFRMTDYKMRWEWMTNTFERANILAFQIPLSSLTTTRPKFHEKLSTLIVLALKVNPNGARQTKRWKFSDQQQNQKLWSIWNSPERCIFFVWISNRYWRWVQASNMYWKWAKKNAT